MWRTAAQPVACFRIDAAPSSKSMSAPILAVYDGFCALLGEVPATHRAGAELLMRQAALAPCARYFAARRVGSPELLGPRRMGAAEAEAGLKIA